MGGILNLLNSLSLLLNVASKTVYLNTFSYIIFKQRFPKCSFSINLLSFQLRHVGSTPLKETVYAGPYFIGLKDDFLRQICDFEDK